jgi:hypothetical protein
MAFGVIICNHTQQYNTACLACQEHKDYIRPTALQSCQMRRNIVRISLAQPHDSMLAVNSNDLSKRVGIPFIHFILFYLLS